MRNTLVMLAMTAVLTLTAVTPVLAQTTDPVAVLKSDAPAADKMEACRTLQRTGGPEAVPALAALLNDQTLAHMARYALQSMPCPEAGDALRAALGTTSGRLKVGVISSLDIRKDVQAIPQLIPLLADADAEVVQTAALALGKLATPEAAKALQDALGGANITPANLWALCNGLLGCAEVLMAQGQNEQAAAIYDRLLEVPNAAPQTHAGALRGAVLARGGQQGLPLLLQALRGEDAKQFDAALRAARELAEDAAVTTGLAAALSDLDVNRKIRLVQVLGYRKDAAAGPALLALAEEGPVEVRIAALRALTQIGYAPALDLIVKLAGTGEAELAKAAQDSLSYFPGHAGDTALLAMLEDKDVAARLAAVALVRQGGLDEPVAPLMKAAQTDKNESVRVAALEALAGFAGIDEMPALLKQLVEARSAAEIQAAQKALQALCERQEKMPGGSNIVIQKAVYGALPDGPSADVTDKVAQAVAAGAPAIAASNAEFGDTAPSVVKQLRVDYTFNGTPVTKTVGENETLKLTTPEAPPVVVDAFCTAFGQAKGETKVALLLLLRTTASPKALEAVQATAASGEGAVKEAAQRVLCDWPTPSALPAVLEMVANASDPTMKVLALRGAVRLLKQQSDVAPAELVATYSALMNSAQTADEKKTVLSGLAQVPDAGALGLALSQWADEAVKAEALQAASAIAASLGKAAREDASIFNGTDLTGWESSNLSHWRVEDGALVGQCDAPLTATEYIWAPGTVADFYLCVDAKLEPNTGNSGIQFRSEKRGDNGEAFGSQADMGQDVWARIYDQGGRGKLDWNDRGEKAVKPGEWNRYEVLVVGPAVWTAINGQLGVACLDLAKESQRSGLIGIQLHAGVVEKVSYKFVKLVHDPKVELAGLTAEQLIAELAIPGQQ